jgi:hypothetical protein
MTRPRRGHSWFASLIGLALILALVQPVAGQNSTRTDVALTALFPTPAQLPAGAVLVEEGARSLDEIAGTFPDPADARQVLTTYGWAENAYRVYTVPAPVTNTPTGGPLRLEISLHRFALGEPGPMYGCSACGAAFALPYFAHGRAVLLGQQEVIDLGTSPCELEVVGTGSVEFTFAIKQQEYLRSLRTLIAAGHHRDAFITARTMVEGFGRLFWAFQGKPEQTNRWFWFGAIVDYRQTLENGKTRSNW